MFSSHYRADYQVLPQGQPRGHLCVFLIPENVKIQQSINLYIVFEITSLRFHELRYEAAIAPLQQSCMFPIGWRHGKQMTQHGSYSSLRARITAVQV